MDFTKTLPANQMDLADLRALKKTTAPRRIIPDHCPEHLRKLRRWICWKAVKKNGEYSKQPRGGTSTSRETWLNFDDAVALLKENIDWTGLAYVFADDDGLTGIDLDLVRDPETEAIVPAAEALIERFASYCEVSPSGTGFKIWIIGEKPAGMPCSGDRFAFPFDTEIYSGGRFFCFTGDWMTGDRDAFCPEVQNGQAVLDWIMDEKVKRTPAPALTQARQNVSTPTDNGREMHRAGEYAAKATTSIRPGNRNSSFFELTGKLHERFYLNREDIASIVIDANAKLSDPLASSELDTTIQNSLDRARPYDPALMNNDNGAAPTRLNGAAPAKAKASKKTASSVDPQKHCDSFLALPQNSFDGHSVYRRWRGEWFIWREGAYESLGKEHIEKLIRDSIKAMGYRHITTNVVKETVATLKSDVWLDDKIEFGDWIVQRYEARDLLCFRDEILDMRTGKAFPNTPALFSSFALPMNVGEYTNAKPPNRWLAFLGEVFENDCEIKSLQQFFGYCLTRETNQQKGLLIVGPPRSGKGTILRTLEQLLGSHNVAKPTLNQFGTQFGLSCLIGKTAALIGECHVDARVNRQEIIGNIKSIIGEDGIQIDRKHREPWAGRVGARIIAAANEIPNLRDESRAFANRFIVLQTPVSFLGREDQTLDEKLADELPGILQWAMEGYRAYKASGRLYQGEASKQAIKDIEAVTAPFRTFIEDNIEYDPNARTPTQIAYEVYRSWCESNGQNPWAKNKFSAALIQTSELGKVRQSRPNNDGNRVRCFAGLRVRSGDAFHAACPGPPSLQPGPNSLQPGPLTTPG